MPLRFFGAFARQVFANGWLEFDRVVAFGRIHGSHPVLVHSYARGQAAVVVCFCMGLLELAGVAVLLYRHQRVVLSYQRTPFKTPLVVVEARALISEQP